MLILAAMKSFLFAALVLSGCYVEDRPHAVYAGGGGQVAVEGDGADLVEVSPGVEVVADYGEPVFYADNYYWANRGGIWYSSTYYGGGWGRASYVPNHITSIRNREGYTHYRPTGYVRGRTSGPVRGNASYRVRSAPGHSHSRR